MKKKIIAGIMAAALWMTGCGTGTATDAASGTPSTTTSATTSATSTASSASSAQGTGDATGGTVEGAQDQDGGGDGQADGVAHGGSSPYDDEVYPLVPGDTGTCELTIHGADTVLMEGAALSAGTLFQDMVAGSLGSGSLYADLGYAKGAGDGQDDRDGDDMDGDGVDAVYADYPTRALHYLTWSYIDKSIDFTVLEASPSRIHVKIWYDDYSVLARYMLSQGYGITPFEEHERWGDLYSWQVYDYIANSGIGPETREIEADIILDGEGRIEHVPDDVVNAIYAGMAEPFIEHLKSYGGLGREEIEEAYAARNGRAPEGMIGMVIPIGKIDAALAPTEDGEEDDIGAEVEDEDANADGDDENDDGSKEDGDNGDNGDDGDDGDEAGPVDISAGDSLDVGDMEKVEEVEETEEAERTDGPDITESTDSTDIVDDTGSTMDGDTGAEGSGTNQGSV